MQMFLLKQLQVCLIHLNTRTSSITNNTTDRILSVGIGTSTSDLADGFEVFKDGKIYADQLALNEITQN